MNVTYKKCLPVIAFAILAALSPAQTLPGVAISGTAAFAPAPDGGIQAIDLQTGKVIWQSLRAQWPLAVAAGRVVALGNIGKGNDCTLDLLDVSTGKVLTEMGPIQFAPWASVRFEYLQKSDSTFRIWSQSLTSAGALILWKAERWPPGDWRHLGQQQQRQYASGRITIGFDPNSVQSKFGPVAARPPELGRPDKSLPLLRGQRAISSIYVGSGGETMLALVATGSETTLQCFGNRVLQWSRLVATKLS